MTIRTRYASGAPWEVKVGYSRAVRVGDRVHVTGTTAHGRKGERVGEGDAYAQTRQCLANIERALGLLGASMAHVVRTRIFVTDIAKDWQDVGRAHAEALGAVGPATTMVEVRRLIEDWMVVEIEADADLGEYGRSLALEVGGEHDRNAINRLLHRAELPPVESNEKVELCVLKDGDAIVACIGWERHGDAALIRSLAVEAKDRRRGAGNLLVEAALFELRAQGVREVYLQTLDAQPFFTRHGFAVVTRDTLVAAIAGSRQLEHGHCQNATAMILVIEGSGST